ncbi:MAG: hypothetical protein M3Q70_01280 [bacterium]|nr:hypothetical protein [bacterium]
MNKKQSKKTTIVTNSITKKNIRSTLLKNKKNLAVAVLALLVGILGFFCIVLYKYTNSNIGEINSLITRTNEASNASLGFSCGAFTLVDAEKFLGGEVTMRSLVQGSYLYGQKLPNGGELGINEGCYYELKSNNSFYASVRVATYTSDHYADFGFKDLLLHNISDKSEEGHPAGRLVFSDQGYSFLKGSRILLVSADKGNPSTYKSDSKALLDMVINKLP